MNAAHWTRSLEFWRLLVTGSIAGIGMWVIFGTTNKLIFPYDFGYFYGWQNLTTQWGYWPVGDLVQTVVLTALISAAFALFVSFLSQDTCPYSLAVRYLLGILSGILIWWAAVGLLFVCIQPLFPQRYVSFVMPCLTRWKRGFTAPGAMALSLAQNGGVFPVLSWVALVFGRNGGHICLIGKK